MAMSACFGGPMLSISLALRFNNRYPTWCWSIRSHHEPDLRTRISRLHLSDTISLNSLAVYNFIEYVNCRPSKQMAHDTTFRNQSRRFLHNKYINERCRRNPQLVSSNRHLGHIEILYYGLRANYISNLNFLTREFTVLRNYVGPFSTFIEDIFHDGEDFILSCADLGCGISFTKGDGAVFDGLEVHCDSEGSSEFIVSSVSTTNRLRGIVYFVGNSVHTKLKRYKLGKN